MIAKCFGIIMAAMLLTIYGMEPRVSAADAEEGIVAIQAKGDQVVAGYYSFIGKPGEIITFELGTRNTSGAHIANGFLYVSDAPVAIGGGMGAVDPEHIQRGGIGSWFLVPEQEIHLRAGEKKDVTLQLTIPKDAAPGDHVAVLTLRHLLKEQERQEIEDGTSVTINKAYAQAIGVLVTVPGAETHKLTLASMETQWDGANLGLALSIRNDGNKVERLKGEIRIYRDGTLLHTEKAEMGSIYPGKVGIYNLQQLPNALKKAGEYTAEVTWEYAGVTESTTFAYNLTGVSVSRAEATHYQQTGETFSEEAIIITKSDALKIAGVVAASIVLIIALVFIIRRRKNGSNRQAPGR
ncbi:hypothetical protein [Paenibacillus sp.]|uniref:COG1470 family protein n=1 Tax=Paenibacillus sp. TaxID=58172 RepID=UPI002D3CA926|nr:hypothetical protein [Paenibacillus sp.]HZG85140.1 hypothetical protein [Paenibacillus sp.]